MSKRLRKTYHSEILLSDECLIRQSLWKKTNKLLRFSASVDKLVTTNIGTKLYISI
jgi:hypothetical protein